MDNSKKQEEVNKTINQAILMKKLVEIYKKKNQCISPEKIKFIGTLVQKVMYPQASS
jgi:hypothetical protein